MSDIPKLLEELTESKVKQIQESNIWSASRFKSIRELSVDTRGELGEEFVKLLLEELGYSVIWARTTDRTQKHWDLQVDDKVTLEVKTATLGSDGKAFQHENIEKDRNYDVLVLLDIAPDAIYLTAAPKHSLPFNERNDNWTINPKRMHRRAHGIQYKWDLSRKDVARREIRSLDDVKRIMATVLPEASPLAGENEK